MSASSYSLSGLRVLEVLARANALGPAADELGVTPGAISQQLKRAETLFGVRLFDRTAAGMQPTEALRAALPDLQAGFAALRQAGTMLAGQTSSTLTLTVGSVFAARWLVWRLGRYHAEAPEIELHLITTGKLIDLNRPDIDGFIRLGSGSWPGGRADLIGGETYHPVCTPELAKKLTRPADLAHLPTIADPAGMLSWQDWLQGAGAGPVPLNGPRFSDPAIAFDAALAGEGVLLAIDMMAEDAIRMGRLAAPLAHRQPLGIAYYFVTPAARSRPPKVRHFIDWIRREIDGSR